MKKSVIILAVLMVFFPPVAAAEEGDTADDQQWASKDQERVPICECTCSIKNDAGGADVYSSTIWFKATADTKCENNNGAKCDGKQGEVTFAGKTKDCIKSFIKKN